MATTGNPKYLVQGYRTNGLLSGFQYHDDVESMLQDYRAMTKIKKQYGGKVRVFRCSNSQEILNPEGEAN